MFLLNSADWCVSAPGIVVNTRIHEDDALLPFEVDHLTARKHGGATTEGNLAWTCFLCNRFKGTDLASIDPESGQIVRLFNPRTEDWSDHFQFEGARIVPLSAVGRVTEYLLQFNLPESVETRRLLQESGRFPISSEGRPRQ